MVPKADVLLVNVAASENSMDRVEHLGLGYLSAVLQQDGIHVAVLDGLVHALSLEQTTREALASAAPIVGISVYEHNYEAVAALASAIRAQRPDAMIVVGGHLASLGAEEVLTAAPAIDVIVVGEGEFTFLELVQARLGGADWRSIPGLAYRDETGLAVRTHPRPLCPDLDQLPFPHRYQLDGPWRKHFFSFHLATSRGCWGHCAYCSISRFYGGRKGFRVRSPQGVLAEMEFLMPRVPTGGTPHFGFADDNFTGGDRVVPDRARHIAEGILQRGWKLRFGFACRPDDVHEDLFRLLKRAGLARVFLGVENGVDRLLRRELLRRCGIEDSRQALVVLQKLGIPADIGFIMFTPETTLSDVAANVEFLADPRIMYGLRAGGAGRVCNRVHPCYGTALWTRFRRTQALSGPFWHASCALKPEVEVLSKCLSAFVSQVSPVERELSEIKAALRRHGSPDPVAGDWIEQTTDRLWSVVFAAFRSANGVLRDRRDPASISTSRRLERGLQPCVESLGRIRDEVRAVRAASVEAPRAGGVIASPV